MKKILISIFIVLCLCLPSYALGPMMNLMATAGDDVTAPAFVSAAIAADGLATTINFDENVTGTENDTFTLDCVVAGDPISLTYSSGSGTTALVFTAGDTILSTGSGESCTLDFNGDPNDFEDDSGNDLADFDTAAVTNNSEQVVPCVAMGASGTYAGWWNGEYAADTDKMCVNSGASTADGTDSGGVILEAAKINGTWGARLDADGDYVRWAAPSTTIDNSGTLIMTVKTPASYSGISQFFEFYLGVNDSIYGWVNNSTEHLWIAYRSGGTTVFCECDLAGAELPTSDTTIIKFTWDDDLIGDDLCIKVGANAWDCENRDMGDGSNMTNFSLGDDQKGTYGVSDLFDIDDVQMIEGFQQ